jgi:VWFA-related protein
MTTSLRVLVLCLLALPLLAQTAAPEPKSGTEKLTIDYIEVPVNVVDRSGNPVRGLTRTNFEIYDNKKRVPVTSFEMIDFTSQDSLRRSSGNPAAHRSFLLVFDLGYSSPRSLARAQEAARSFVTKNVQRGDLVSVATLDNRIGYKVVSGFTSDREATLAAIRNPEQFRAVDPLQLASAAAWNKVQADADADANKESRQGVDINEIRQAAMGMEENQRQEDERHRIHNEINWLSQLAASLRNIRGRKQIVLLSEGFDSRLISGRTAKDKNQENEEAAAIISGAWYMGGTARQIDMDQRYGSNSALTSLQVLAQAFTGSDVTLNAIDIQGIRAQISTEHGELQSTGDGLHLLATPTGGTVFQNSNDLTENFARMLHQQEFVYVLGFQTTMTDPGKLHDLKVNLVDVPGGVRAMHRLGYFEGGTKFTPTERTINTADVIVRDIPQDAVHIAALPVPFPAVGEKAAVPVVLEISGADLLRNANGDDVAAELFLYAFDDSGRVVDRIFDRLALSVKTSGDKLRENGVKYIANLSLPPGNYAVKTLVRIAGSDKMGFSRNDIRVPKAGEVALLPLFVLDDPKSWLLVDGRKGMPYPFAVNGEPFLPSVTGRISADVVRKVAVFVENAQPEELTWETTPQSTLLAQVKTTDATKLVLQVDGQADNFGVIVHKAEAVLRASTALGAVAKQ